MHLVANRRLGRSFYQASVRDYCGAGPRASFRVVEGSGRAPRRRHEGLLEVVVVGAYWLARQCVPRFSLIPES